MSSSEDTNTQSETCEKSEETTPLDMLTEKVDQLFKFRDHYFENHTFDGAANRNADIKKEMDAVLQVFKEIEESGNKIITTPRYYFLKGRALNVLPQYNKQAEDLLSKAIKFDPKLVDAWNELGECFWKNNKMFEAMHCFQGAMKYQKNKISLRSLSMLIRQQETKTHEEKVKNIKQGLLFAKQAVEMDDTDGLSWAVLGNAYLSSFFGIEQNPRILEECLKAYAQAETDIVAKNTPDLHYNKGVILKYEQEYEEALKALNKAALCEPTWDPPKEKENELLRYLKDICLSVKKSGKIKTKKLQKIIQSVDSKQLGPYEGGTYTSSVTGQSATVVEIPFSELKPELNGEKVILGKVVCQVRDEDGVPFTFCMVDKTGACIAVTVFNLAGGKEMIISDSVAIPDPYVIDVDFTYKENQFKFRLVRVASPLVLVINGKKTTPDYQAAVTMSMFQKFD